MSPADQIIIVEDDADLRETLADLLRIKGYDVITAGNGEEALQSLHAVEDPCLILLDLMMPVMDGWTFRARLLEDSRLQSVPVAVFSGVDDCPEQAAVLSAVAHLTKPIQFDAVLNLVQRHC